jgi:ABC-type polysaccharide/polyol phosphate export permease
MLTKFRSVSAVDPKGFEPALKELLLRLQTFSVRNIALAQVNLLVRNFHQIFPNLLDGTYFVLPPIFAITTLLKQKKWTR